MREKAAATDGWVRGVGFEKGEANTLNAISAASSSTTMLFGYRAHDQTERVNVKLQPALLRTLAFLA